MCWLPYRDQDGNDLPYPGCWDENGNRDPEARGSDDPPEHITRAFAGQESDDGYDRDCNYSRHTDSPVELPDNTANNIHHRMLEKEMDLFDHWLENYVSTTVEIDPANPPPWWGKTLEEIRQCTEDPFAPTAPATSSAEAGAIIVGNYYTDDESDHGADNAPQTWNLDL